MKPKSRWLARRRMFVYIRIGGKMKNVARYRLHDPRWRWVYGGGE